jgi:hypothetical protein
LIDKLITQLLLFYIQLHGAGGRVLVQGKQAFDFFTAFYFFVKGSGLFRLCGISRFSNQGYRRAGSGAG